MNRFLSYRVVLNACAALAVVAFVPGLALANPPLGTFTIPDSGADVGEMLTALITGVGAIVVIALGGFAAFKIIRMGLRWVRVAMG